MSHSDEEDISSEEPVTWMIEGSGTAHIYCGSTREAKSLVAEVQSILGSNLERDGDFVYVKYGYSDVSEALDGAPKGTTEEDAIAEMERLDNAAAKELTDLGFAVRREP